MPRKKHLRTEEMPDHGFQEGRLRRLYPAGGMDYMPGATAIAVVIIRGGNTFRERIPESADATYNALTCIVLQMPFQLDKLDAI